MHSILYIDDEPHSLTSFKLTFEDEFKVYTALSTREGYEILKSNSIQLVVTDQRMPEETGVEFLNRIKSEFPRTVRTILTGYSDIEAIIDAINESHIYYYFKKPWKETELKLAFKNAIEAALLAIENQGLVTSLETALLEVQDKRVALSDQLAERKELVRKLEKSSQIKSEFLSIISHELRTPLNPIIGLSDMMVHMCDDEEDRDNLQLIHKSGNDLLKMINSIIEFVYQGTRAIGEERHPIDINSLVDDFVEMARANLGPDTNVSVHGFVLRDGVEARERVLGLSQPDSLRQLLQNIVANACKFTSSGSITLAANLITAENKPQSLKLTIEDTGIGIKPDDLERIFETFTQVEQGLSRKYNGLGLGLAISKQLAENLGAKIEVSSEEGQGSTFTLDLPFPSCIEQPAEPIQNLKGEMPLKHQKCLVVENTPLKVSLTRIMLEKLGADAQLATVPQDALVQLGDSEFNYIFVADATSHTNTVEIGRQLREQISPLSSSRLIALTTSEEDLKELHASESPFDAALQTPLTLARLREHLKLPL